jgi:hypothetical protein
MPTQRRPTGARCEAGCEQAADSGRSTRLRVSREGAAREVLGDHHYSKPLDRDAMRCHCPGCGDQFAVDAATYGKALRADAQYLRDGDGYGSPEDLARADEWDVIADRLDPDPRQGLLFGGKS